MFLLFISFFIFSEAVERLVEPPEVKHERLLVVSVLGFIVNLVGIFIFQVKPIKGFSHLHTFISPFPHTYNKVSPKLAEFSATAHYNSEKSSKSHDISDTQKPALRGAQTNRLSNNSAILARSNYPPLPNRVGLGWIGGKGIIIMRRRLGRLFQSQIK